MNRTYSPLLGAPVGVLTHRDGVGVPRDATVGGLEVVRGGAVVGDEGAEVLLGLAQRDGDIVSAEVGQRAAAVRGALVGAVDYLWLHSLGW